VFSLILCKVLYVSLDLLGSCFKFGLFGFLNYACFMDYDYGLPSIKLSLDLQPKVTEPKLSSCVQLSLNGFPEVDLNVKL